MADKAKILSTLQEVCAHKLFTSSPAATKFLSHIVNKCLDNEQGNLTETTIAQDLFDKGADFDPSRDSVVRVTARRVRNLLAQYNSQQVAKTGLVISIPKGRYYPIFEIPDEKAECHLNTEQTNIVASQSRWIIPAISMIALIVVVGFYLLKPGPISNTDTLSESPITNPQSHNMLSQEDIRQMISTYPRIAVTPFENITGNESYNFLEIALQRQLLKDLSRYKVIRPTLYTHALETGLIEIRDTYQYIISGQILAVEPELDLNVRLIDLGDSHKVYQRRIKRELGDDGYYDILTKIVSEISADVAGSQSAISLEQLSKIEKEINLSDERLSPIRAIDCITLANKTLSFPGPEIYNCLLYTSDAADE